MAPPPVAAIVGRDDVLQTQERTGHVDRHDTEEIVEWIGGDRAHWTFNACVVEENINSAHDSVRLLHVRGYGPLIGDVRDDRQVPWPGRQSRGEPLERARVVIYCDDACAAGGHEPHGGGPDLAAGAGDYGDLPVQSMVIEHGQTLALRFVAHGKGRGARPNVECERSGVPYRRSLRPLPL
jgi:hypothetical protein